MRKLQFVLVRISQVLQVLMTQVLIGGSAIFIIFTTHKGYRRTTMKSGTASVPSDFN